MSASVWENTLITISLVSDCFMLFYLMTSTSLLRWGACKIWNEIPEQMPETPLGSRPEEQWWGWAGRRSLVWNKGKFGRKPQRLSLRAAEPEPLFREKLDPTEHLKSHWWQSEQAQLCLHPQNCTASFCPQGWCWKTSGMVPGMSQDNVLGTLLHCPSDPRTRLHGLSASAVIFSFVKS